jgi:Fe-S-cluster containining protein
VQVYALSFHADYRCAHSGVCCSSDWDVPVELPIYRSLEAALKAGQIQPVAPAYGGDPPLITGDDLPDDAAAMLGRTATGDCVFYHRGSGLCVIHRDGGAAQLPSTCRTFPRVAVRDARGTFVSLSHFCPTAAASLFREDGGTEIVEAPPAFPPGDYDGLTVDEDAWPPLLHPSMLMDLDGYSAWERHMVARCADSEPSPETVLATLRRDARLLRTFVPGPTTLSEAVAALPRDLVQMPPHDSLDSSLALREQVLTAIPDDLTPAADEVMLPEAFGRYVAPAWSAWQRPLKRYLAAKAFANWTAYQGRGVLAIVHGLEAALALVRVEASRRCRNESRGLDADVLREAIRSADFALNHLAVGEELADTWSQSEGDRG